MKGKIMLKILEGLADGLGEISDLFEAYLSAGYGASYRKLDYKRDKAAERRLGKKWEREKKRKEKQKFYNYLNYLKGEGLINKKDSGMFRLTKRGKARLEELEKRKKVKGLPFADYPKEKSHRLILVAFDVPEKERQKRDWLRSALKGLDFNMIQKSLFGGKIKIPEEFLEDIHELKLTDYVEILEISREGTLKRKKLNV